MSKLILPTITLVVFLQDTFSESSALARKIKNTAESARVTTGCKAKGETGCTICQSGETVIEFTAHGVNMHIGKLGFTIIVKAPKWDAYFFNEKFKNYAVLSYKDWFKRLDCNSIDDYQDNQGKFALVTESTGNSMTIQKHRCSEYLVFRKAEPKKRINEEKISQLWIASDIKLPMHTTRIFCRFLEIPDDRGFPFKATSFNKGDLSHTLDTLSVEKHRISTSSFEPLIGYKRAKNMTELVLGKSVDQFYSEVLNKSVNNWASIKKVSNTAKGKELFKCTNQ